jgi:bifunctional non-homologous end joining protein LigD
MKNSLNVYNKKRDFTRTGEPAPYANLSSKVSTKEEDSGGKVEQVFRFVIQEHDATNLHYDFRIEFNGVLVSWAVPKGLPYKNSDKRLAMKVEDHPLDYFDFEGTIPEGNYGAGSVIVWDWGNYWVPHAKDEKEVIEKLENGFEKGEVKLILNGKKVKGLFALVRFKKAGENAWLMIKDKDEFEGINFFKKENSVKSGQTLEQLEKKEKTENLKFTPPMLATLGGKAFDDPDYIFEHKFDGYRTIAVVKDHKVELFSRKGEKMNRRFPEVVKTLEKLRVDCILDGEVVGYDKKGKANFQLVKDDTNRAKLIYHVFDILDLNGIDTTVLPLLERKKFLKKALPKDKKNLEIVKFIKEKGKELFKSTLKSHEGIIAKRSDSRYFPGQRTDAWIKIKNQLRQEFVIGGITQTNGNRSGFGSLIVGYFKNEKLIYCGHIGTGFDDELITKLLENFRKIERKDSPFANYSDESNLQMWVEPIIVCEATFAEMTRDGMIRQASFVGIRTDKFPKQATNEDSVFERILTHPDKIFFSEKKYTKLDLAKYYFEIAPTLLPYLKDRPQNLNRHPEGIHGISFYQKDIEFEVPEFVKIAKVKRDEPKFKTGKQGIDKEISYILCQNTETLIFMANLGCIEINPWLSHVKTLSKPDFLVFDIDPNNVDFEIVINVAKLLYKFLEELGIKPFIKTSGKRGLHLYVYLGAKYSYRESQNFAEIIAKIFESKYPNAISLERSPDKRKHKVYIDYLQNRKGQTTASIYSCRPTQDASVSTPIEFEELNKKLDPTKFTIKNTLDRVEKKGDLWRGIWKEQIDLEKVITKMRDLKVLS